MKEDFMLRICQAIEVICEGKADEKRFSSLEGDRLLMNNTHDLGPSSPCTIKCRTALGRLACFWLHKLTKLTSEV
jgi:hypothetical protein